MRDALGRDFDFSTPPRRVVSLVPSLTETLFELGAGESVVGATRFCIFPSLMSVARVGGTKNPDVGVIRQLGPDLVYVNIEENLRKHAQAIGEFAPVFSTEPKSAADVIQLISDLGAIHGKKDRAHEITIALEEELPRNPQPFTFACPIWKDPWMWCGGDTYVSNLVSAAGGINVLADHERYPVVELLDVRRLRPDVVFLPDEPFEFVPNDAQQLQSLGLTVIGPFAGHLFTWHGARTLLGLRFLSDRLAELERLRLQTKHQ